MRVTVAIDPVQAPAAVSDLDARAGPSPGTAGLSWTSPGAFGASYDLAGGRFFIRFATNPFTNFTPPADIVIATDAAPGSAQIYNVADLEPATTYYFGLKSANALNNVSSMDARSATGFQARAFIEGIARVTDLAAAPGPTVGSVRLAWTEPRHAGTTDPRTYDIRASTTGQILDTADFSAAKPISEFSSTAMPLPGPGGGAAVLVIHGLDPGRVHYFAIREQDSGSPQAVGAWSRDTALGWNVNNFAAASTGLGPVPVSDLGAVPGTSEGDIRVSWTAPSNASGVPLAAYELRYATFSAAGLGLGADAWFSAAPLRLSIATTTAFGSAESLVVVGLDPGTTFYFGLKSRDRDGNSSLVDALSSDIQARCMPRNLPPASPGGLNAAAGLNRAGVSWTALTAAQKGLDFAYYRVQRSTEAGQDFVSVATVAAGPFVDRFLKPHTTYYYRLSARDRAGLESAVTSAVAVTPFNLPPMAPLGVRAAFNADGSSVTFTWSPTRRWEDGTIFDSTAAPTENELQGYSILRSTEICVPNFHFLSSAAVETSSFTAYPGGELYYYKILAYNSEGPSTSTVVLSSLGERNFFLPDCASRLIVGDQEAAALSKATNGHGADIEIERRQISEDIGGPVFQSVEFKAMKEGASEVKDFHFDKPVRVVLRYNAVNGVPVPSASPLSSSSARPASGSAKNLGVYWHNGVEFKKLYGKVDPAAQTLTVDTPNIGLFQVRSLYRADGAVFDLSNLSSRVITPNDDGLNDVVIFTYDPGPNNAQPAGRIYDLQGRFVADMTSGLVPNTLTWDGKMNGRAAASGVYVYEIKGDGKTFNGTIVVAR